MNRIQRMCVAISVVLAGMMYVGCLTPVEAQNVTCPTRPLGDNSNACASTAFVQAQITASGGGVITPAQFGAKCDNATDDTTAFINLGLAVQASLGNVTIQFPAGASCIIYNSGQSVVTPTWNWTNVNNVLIKGNGATIKHNHTFGAGEGSQFISCNTCTFLAVDGLNLIQTVANPVPMPQPEGVQFMAIANTSVNISLSNFTITGGQLPIIASNTKNVYVWNVQSINSGYGVVFGQGTNTGGMIGVQVDNLITQNVARSIFIKGISDAHISVTSLNPRDNDILISTTGDGGQSNSINEHIFISYKVLPRTAGTSGPYIWIGNNVGSIDTGVKYRDIHVDLNMDLSGDTVLATAFTLAKGTTSSLSTTFENISFSGRIVGVPNLAGTLIELFRAADSPWSGEAANGIVLRDLYVTGSTTPVFYIDYAPFPTGGNGLGALTLHNFGMPGNYTDANDTNIQKQLVALGANFGNTSPVVTASFGGTGLFQPTANSIPITGGVGPFSLLAPTAGQVVIGTAGAPHANATINALVKGNGAADLTAYAGTSCTNQFPRSLSGSGVATCATVANTDLANPSLTVAIGSSVGISTSGCATVSLGGTCTIGSISDAVRFGTLALNATIGSSTFAANGTLTNGSNVGVISFSPSLIFSVGANAAYGQINQTDVQNTGGDNSVGYGNFFQTTTFVSGGHTQAATRAFQARTGTSGASPTGTISEMSAFVTASPQLNHTGSPTLTISASRGMFVQNQGISSAGITNTNGYGIYVDAQSGATNNYALWYNSGSPTIIQASGGVSIGANTDPGAGGFLVNGSTITLTGLATDAAHTDRTVCQDTTSKNLFFGSGAAGICLGTSSERFKHDIHPLSVGLDQIMKLKAVSYKLNADHGDPDKLLYGFTAEQGVKVLPALVGRDEQGRPQTFDYMGVVPVLVKAIQELKADNDNIYAELKRRGVR